MQQNGRNGPTAHQIGITAENTINGTKSLGGKFDATRTTLSVPVIYNGNTTTVIVNFTKQQVISVQNNTK